MIRQPFLSKIAYIFLFTYIVLYCFSTQFFPTFIFKPIWSVLVPRFATLVGATVDANPFATGSGDTYFNYYQLYLFVVISLFTAIIVGLVNRRRENFYDLHKWLLFLLRYYIAFQMINYGLAKIFYLQFGEISIHSLRQPLGELTPMGLLWRFMGFSKAYCVFTGLAEFIGGILLLSRRTTLLGALITFGVMVNVMMMNYCYDVPVKLLSTHLVFFSLVLILYWYGNLVDFFIKGKSFTPTTIEDIVREKYQKIRMYVKWSLILLFLGNSCYMLNSYAQKIAERKRPKVAIHGIFEVEEFKVFRDNELIENPGFGTVWKEMFIKPDGEVEIELLSGYPLLRTMTLDTSKSTIALNLDSTDSILSYYSYKFLEDGQLQLNGNLMDDSLSILLRPKKPFRLTNTGFNWVNQYPNNR